ncbi:PHB depolymerase family esterase [Hymenobacter sp. UYCo722]|uniref:extracellular catalytic domain type 1 short-chain-length polyhydroxyalkanoate depolymerase n=1 Tax=Hymenobacter sp. UYCo722 TaxID=3156335 RepID=UPI00339B77CE
MKKAPTYILNLILLLALSAAPVALRAQTTIIRTLQAGGLTREYRLYVPAIYTRTTGAVPLLLNLHGYSSNNLEQENYGDFRPLADTANFLVVHPNGTIDGAGNRNWNTFGPRGTGVDDVAFLSTLIDTLARRYRVDLNRVYSTGMSNGGFMSYELACQLGNRIAAIASVTGSMTAGRLAGCTSGRPVPVLEIHGTADNTVPYNGGTALQFVAIPTLLNSWVQRNGCTPTPTITAVPDINTADGCTAERSVWAGGRNGSVVEHFRIIGGGHTWPGAAFVVGVTNQDISASREAWRFLRRYRLSTLLPTRGAIVPATPQLQLLPNPATDLLQLDAGQRLTAEGLTVRDALGRAVPASAQLLPDGRLQVATAAWPAGLYLLAVALPGGQVLHQKLLKQ